ncbi:hypothetical protein LIER_11689 [Lithospermum erythrorhizon]|uniref:Uncharacterized protein n=1 Tax=Lithospermum erythrorhizon TaxID=34254 RepID=A0AAV3PNY6_LITER
MSNLIFSLLIGLLFLSSMGLAKRSIKNHNTPTPTYVLPIPVEGIPVESMNQTYERQLGDKHMYAFLLNNCRNVENKKFRIANLTLTYNVNVSAAGTFQIIAYERKPDDGITMYYLHDQDGEALYGVEEEDFDFDVKMSAFTDKKVVYQKAMEAGATAGTVAVETQKFYDYGSEGIPNLMVFVMIKTPIDPNGLKHFIFKREMHYMIDQ